MNRVAYSEHGGHRKTETLHLPLDGCADRDLSSSSRSFPTASCPPGRIVTSSLSKISSRPLLSPAAPCNLATVYQRARPFPRPRNWSKAWWTRQPARFRQKPPVTGPSRQHRCPASGHAALSQLDVASIPFIGVHQHGIGIGTAGLPSFNKPTLLHRRHGRRSACVFPLRVSPRTCRVRDTPSVV